MCLLPLVLLLLLGRVLGTRGSGLVLLCTEWLMHAPPTYRLHCCWLSIFPSMSASPARCC